VRRALAVVTLVAALAGGGIATAQSDLAAYVAGDRRSGFTFLSPETRALQTDEFRNPGMLWVEEGERQWNAAVPGGQSCATCHKDAAATMKGVAARYPAYDDEQKHVINLEQQINQCRGRQKQPALAWESRELLALTAYVSRQSLGMPVAVKIDGPAAQSFAHGKAEYEMRRGQLDLSCASCHESQVGAKLRAEVISQGQVNGFPIYRQLWQTMGSTQRMIAWCNEAVRAEPYPAGSQETVDLELYAKWRARGLPVETPAVRR
jgi:sulfur-oxidizing protein SoxA